MSTTLTWDLIARDRASDKFDKIGRSADDAGSKFKKLGTVAKVGAAALAGGAIVAGKALFDMAKGAMEDEAAQAKLAQTMKRTTGATDEKIAATEAWISAQGRALGVTDDEMRPALQRLMEATGDTSEAMDLMRLAMDVSAGSGKSLKTVSEGLMKAQNGSVGALSKLGIETKNAKGETLSFEQATRKMADTFKGQAATAAETTEGKFRRLKVTFDEAKESLGAKLLPIAEKFATWTMSKAVPAVQQFASSLGEKFGPIVAKVGGWIREKLLPALGSLARDLLPQAKAAFGNVKAAISDAKPFFELVGKIVTNVLIPGIGKLARVVLPVLGGGLRLMGKLLGAVGNAGKWMWNNVLQPVFSGIVKAIGKVIGFFGRMLQTMGKAPGMGWVGDLGDKLVAAGDKATGMANNIRKIPDSHNTKITADTSQANANLNAFANYLGRITQPRTVNLFANWKGASGNPLVPGNARGTSFWRGGVTLVGEEGPELVNLPRGSRINSAQETRGMLSGIESGGMGLTAQDVERAFRRALESLPIVRLPDAGRGAYLRGAV